MHSELFRVFGLPIRSWGVLLLVGAVVAWWLLHRRAARYGIPKEKIGDLVAWGLILGVVGGRLAFVLVEWKQFSADPVSIVRVDEGGLTSYGGYVFALLACWLWRRANGVSWGVLLDWILAPGLVLIAFGRIGCFLNGCCGGAECDLPWAVTFPGDPTPVHPAQLYDAAMAFASAGLLLLLEPRWLRRRGMIAGLGLVLLGVTRYVYEVFRAGASSEIIVPSLRLTLAQVVAMVVALAGLTYLVLAARRPEAEA
jgi:phosphatidylglycerol:prolipoprotein diacylglycerol transferase